MQVVGQTSAGGLAEIHAYVEGLWRIRSLQSMHAELGDVHQLGCHLRIQLCQVTSMGVRRHHEMPAVIRIQVQQHEDVLGAKEHQVALVIAGRSRNGTQKAAAGAAIGALQVGAPPRCPQPLHSSHYLYSVQSLDNLGSLTPLQQVIYETDQLGLSLRDSIKIVTQRMGFFVGQNKYLQERAKIQQLLAQTQ